MTISDISRETLLKTIEKGFNNGIQSLAKLSGANWHTVMSTILTADDGATSVPGELSRIYYGVSFTMAGGDFLVLFSDRSAAALTNSFIIGSGVPAPARKDLDADGLAEIANIMVNAVMTPLADACHLGLIVSAPKVASGRKDELYGAALKGFSGGAQPYSIIAAIQFACTGLVSNCTMVIIVGPEWLRHLDEALGAANPQ